jgi:flavin reductase (DIM6/NTAB) family NADH-FMN oxidoreductase RutF
MPATVLTEIIGIASSTPPTIGISIRKPRYTLELMLETNEFSANIPSAAIFRKVDYCGITTGRKKINLWIPD